MHWIEAARLSEIWTAAQRRSREGILMRRDLRGRGWVQRLASRGQFPPILDRADEDYRLEGHVDWEPVVSWEDYKLTGESAVSDGIRQT